MPSLSRLEATGRPVAVAAAAGLGTAAWRTTIVGREAQGPSEFIVVGGSVLEVVATVGATALAVIVAHVVLLTIVQGLGGRREPLASGRYLLPLFALCAPIAGVAAAIWGGRPAPAVVYWMWELAPWWLLTAVLVTAGAALASSGVLAMPRLAGVSINAWPRFGRAGVEAILGIAVASWIVTSDASLRTWRAPIGDEPRYLRYAESWYQGQGTDISRVVPIASLPRDAPPRVHRSLASAGRAFVSDAKQFAADVTAWLTQPGFVWNRAHGSDGSFVVGRDGGVYQSHQPGLALLLLPAYVLDRRVLSAGTSYRGQFPDRLFAVFSTLVFVAAFGSVALAALCRHVGLGVAAAAGLGALAWASLPMSALALQIYPETAAGLAIVTALAMLGSAPHGRLRTALAGAVAGFPLLLHVRFLAVAVVLVAFGLWAVRHSRTHASAFAAGAIVPVALQVWYVYHATGVPWPAGFYDASAVSSINPGGVPLNVLRFLVDRDWGLLPHVPLLLLAIPGVVPLWRARRALAVAVVLMAAALLATGAAHSVTAAGGTPGRLVAAIVPVLFVPIAAAVREWGKRPLFHVVFALLAVLSLDQAWDYNRGHVQGVGLFVTAGASGWRINRLFPYLSDGLDRAAAPLLATLVVAIAALTAMLLRPGREAPVSRRFRAALAVGVAVMLMITSARAWDEWHPRYRYSNEQARAALVGAYVHAGSCRLCWSSRSGPVSPRDLASNALGRLALDAETEEPYRVRFRLTATGPDGPVFGTVRFEFGDGEVSAPRVMAGRLDVAHEYRSAGSFHVKAWVDRPGEAHQMAALEVHVEAPPR